MKKREAKPVTVDEVPELMAYELAKRKLDNFKNKHAALIEELTSLAEAHNTALEAADKAMRANSYTCAPFNLQHFTTKYNADEAFVLLGRNGFLAAGGKVETKEVYEIDKDRFEAAISQGKIADEVVEKVRTETPTYKKPKPLAV
jgi:hypothetical protein